MLSFYEKLAASRQQQELSKIRAGRQAVVLIVVSQEKPAWRSPCR
jgi:hypothetical protein